MMRTLSSWLAVASTFGLVACTGPKPLGTDDADSDSDATEESGGEEVGDPTDDPEPEPETTGANFLVDNGDGIVTCDPWAQDCPEGEKCVPYGSTGGNWDANKCVPVQGDGSIGDSCTWDGTVSATDSCGADSHCWDVMEIDGQLEGVCTPFCEGSANSPICGPGTSCLIANEGAITLCVQTCDPLLQECSDGLGCFWANDDFQCIFTAGEIMPEQPCGYINDCAPGMLCASADVLPACDNSSCCTPFCDLADPTCDNLETECMPFFEEGTAPPTYEDVGLCVLPGA